MKVTGTSCLVFFVLLYSSDAAITGWTLPSGGDASISIAEDAAANAAVATIVATTDEAPLGAYTLLNASVPFELATTGELTVASATLDFETDQTYKLLIQVVDNVAATGTATLTVSVTDANDAPTFYTFSTCAVDGSAAGTTVYTLTATDQDSGDTLTYSITGGNTGSDFVIASHKIVTANALAMARTASYDLIVQVSDTAATAIATVTVSVSASCNSATALVFSLLTILTALVVALN